MPSGQIVLERLFTFARLPHLNPLPLAGEEANERDKF